ncbi:MAG: adenylyltransferase/cytidyltransferase family protein [bacterium]|nr:adenylyltransferase/cytidyltransferase family protein [bacterium]
MKLKINQKINFMKNAGKNRKPVIVAVSGGFDPVHIGHIRLFETAKKLGDKLVVILNNDNWLMKKKGFVFMPQKERRELLKALAVVDKVILTGHPKNPADMSVSGELKKIRPDIFANGGDRTKKNIPEVAVCEKINCKMVFNVGPGGKIQSSSWLLKKCVNELQAKVHRPWGYFGVIEEGNGFKVKNILVKPKQKLSLQLHHKRAEHWVVLKGKAKVNLNEKIFNLNPHQTFDVPIGFKHRLENPTGKNLEIIEVQSGDYLEEDDIIRFEDKYGRKK